jgi:hypothetical protein
MGDRGATSYAYSGETTEWEVSLECVCVCVCTEAATDEGQRTMKEEGT